MAKSVEINGEFEWETHVFQDDDPEQRTIIGRLRDGTTIKGKARRAALSIGLSYRFFGRWQDTRYGRQFHFSSFAMTEPVGERGIVHYLTMAQGIGRTLAKAIHARFGESSLSTLRDDPEAVADAIDGLTSAVARSASSYFSANIALETTKAELASLFAKRGFPHDLPAKCIERWGIAAPAKVREDVWALTTFPRVGFLLANRLYLELGGDPGAIERQGMCLWHAVRSDSEGHVWFKAEPLREYLGKYISGANIRFDAALKWAVDHERLTVREVNGQVLVAEINLAEHEAIVANCIHEAATETPLWPSVEWSDDEDSGLPSSHQAVELGLATFGVIGVLAGSPGTGKTFTIGHLLRAIGPNPDRVALCAPTGKAAVRMTESISKLGIHLQAKTIHSTLGVISAEGGWIFDHNALNPLEYDFVIVDEASMIDIRLMSALLSARGNAHVLFVGDPDQLSPVGPGAPLRDMIAMGVPCGHLKEVRRNAGTIVRACAEIRDHGRMFWDDELRPESGLNLVHIETTTPEQTIDTIRQILSTADEDRDPVWDYQVLCPINEKSALGRVPLNAMLQGLLNPHGETAGDNPFRVDDKIVCTKNGDIPDAECRDEKHRVMNGEMGEVLEVSERFTIVEIQTPTREVRIPRGKRDKEEGQSDGDNNDTGCCFQLGYALSVHKSQGSEFPVSIIVIDPYPGARRLCDKHWIYTAISRAKDYCITIGQKAHALEMCRKSHMWQRKTFLRERIEELKLADMFREWEEVTK